LPLLFEELLFCGRENKRRAALEHINSRSTKSIDCPIVGGGLIAEIVNPLGSIGQIAGVFFCRERRSLLAPLTFVIELAQFQDFLRSGSTPKFDNPNPFNIHWSKPANFTFSESVLNSPALEMYVVPKRSEVAIHTLSHYLLPHVR
jgi:hypothetical protein